MDENQELVLIEWHAALHCLSGYVVCKAATLENNRSCVLVLNQAFIGSLFRERAMYHPPIHNGWNHTPSLTAM